MATTVAPGWWLEPGTSQHRHHPALPARPHRAPGHCGSTRAAPHACSAGDRRGTEPFKVPLGNLALSSTGNRPQQLLQHSSSQPQPGQVTMSRALWVTQIPTTIACTSCRCPLLYRGRCSPELEAAWESWSSCCVQPCCDPLKPGQLAPKNCSHAAQRPKSPIFCTLI